MNNIPARGRILIRPIEKTTQTTSGFILPETPDEAVLLGTVIGVGKNKIEFGIEIPQEVEVGDTITYAKFTANEILQEGEDKPLKVINQADVITYEKETV